MQKLASFVFLLVYRPPVGASVDAAVDVEPSVGRREKGQERLFPFSVADNGVNISCLHQAMESEIECCLLLAAKYTAEPALPRKGFLSESDKTGPQFAGFAVPKLFPKKCRLTKRRFQEKRPK